MEKKRTKKRWWYTRCPSCGEYGITEFWKIFQTAPMECSLCKKHSRCNPDRDVIFFICSVLVLHAARRLVEAYVWGDCPLWLWGLLGIAVLLLYNRIAPLENSETAHKKIRWWYTRCPHCKQKGIALFDRSGPRFGKEITSCRCCGHTFQINSSKNRFLTLFVLFGVFYVLCYLDCLLPVDLPIWMMATLLVLALYLWLRHGVPLDEYEEDDEDDDREWF